MNHSEVKYLHADASQSIASSPTFDNPHTCAKSKNRSTPRRIPGLSTTDERGFLKSDRELLGGKKKPGSLYAALMLGQLRHDFERDKDGKPGHAQRVHEGQYWVAYSLTYWERQLDLTENEARSGVQCLADSDDVVKVAKFKFGNEPKYLHFRLTEKSLGYVPATPVEDGCVATTQGVCANHTATTPTVLSPTVLDSKDSNKGFLPEDPTGVIPESQQANSEDQTPAPTPDAVVKSPKFEKKKTGPKPKVITPNGDWQHYNRLAKAHDMEALCAACRKARLIQAHRTMLSDDECSYLEQIEHSLVKSHWCTDTLEELLLTGTAEPEHYQDQQWQCWVDTFETLSGKCLSAPAHPDWKFFTKHIGIFLTSPEIDPDPDKQPATPLPDLAACAVCPPAQLVAEPAIECPAITQADQATPAPMLMDDDELGTWQDQLDVWAKDAAAAVKAATAKPKILSASTSPKFKSACHA